MSGEQHGTNEGSLWGGRFASGPSPEMARLSKSTQFDWRLAQLDIRGSKAHAVALHAAGLLDDEQLAAMRAALDELSDRVRTGVFVAAESDEDVHGALEKALAAHYNADDALVFVSGYATNVSVIGQLCGAKDLILTDSAIHNSAVMGAVLSGAARRNFICRRHQ